MHFSIVIPTYNVVRYVRDCLRSAIEQKFDGCHEVILVDDGSTDGTARLARELAEGSHNVRVLVQDNDGAPGKARNRGIEAATGEYVVFLDGDDRLPDGALAWFYDVARAHSPCLIAGARRMLDDAGRETELRPLPVACRGLQAMPRRLDLRLRSLFHNASGKAFRRSVIGAAGVRFPEGHPGQDTAFTLTFMAFAERFFGGDGLVYDVRVRGDVANPSLTQQFDPRAVRRRLTTAHQASDALLQRGMVAQAADLHAYFLLGMFARVMREYRVGRNDELAAIREALVEYRSSRVDRLPPAMMAPALRHRWRLLGPVLSGERAFGLVLWLVRRLGLR
jgi:glycosyltransferase involved in cell wall biosynthesis